MQSLSNQSTRPSSLVVSSPPKELREQFLGYLGSLCGTLPMFNAPQTEHKYPAKHQNAGKQILERVCKMVRTGCAPSSLIAREENVADFRRYIAEISCVDGDRHDFSCRNIGQMIFRD